MEEDPVGNFTIPTGGTGVISWIQITTAQVSNLCYGAPPLCFDSSDRFSIYETLGLSVLSLPVSSCFVCQHLQDPQ